MADLALVVDDDPTIRHTITETLLDEGYDVVTAPDGQVALHRAQDHAPAVILLDYRMPDLDGPRFVQAYRQRPGPHAAIVLVTAAVSAQEQAAEVGADGYLGTPFALDDLVEMVAQHTR